MDVIALLAGIFAGIVSPFVTRTAKVLAPRALRGLGVPVNGLASLALFGLGWWVTGADSARLVEFGMAALAAAQLGSSAVALGGRARGSAQDALSRPLDRE